MTTKLGAPHTCPPGSQRDKKEANAGTRGQEGGNETKQNGLFLFAGTLITGIFFLELLDSSRRIDKLLLAGKEGMTGGANFDAYLTLNRAEFEFVPAGTNSRNLVILRMNIWFHDDTPSTKIIAMKGIKKL